MKNNNVLLTILVVLLLISIGTSGYLIYDNYIISKGNTEGENRDNNLFITGRKKDLIIRGGMNISPKQIEEVLLESGFVRECAVASVIENNEEYILCWYVLNNHIENVAVAFNKIIIEQLGKAYKVDQFIAKKELPKNLNGKMDKELLKKEYLDDCKV